MSEVEKLLQNLRQLARDSKVYVIGIDGLGGAGKSTISALLADALREDGKFVLLLHIDDFIHPRAVRYNDAVPEWECYYYLQWNYETLLAVLAPLKQNATFHGEVRLYEKETDTYRTQALDIPAGSIVIVEGVFLQRSELAEVFDYMIYIDVPEEIRLQRVLQRDGYIGNVHEIADKYERRYFPAERYYVESCHPAELADFVKHGND